MDGSKGNMNIVSEFNFVGNKYACYQEIVYSLFWILSPKNVLCTIAMDIASFILEISLP